MYSGSIEGVGPRYCPSIEDKIVKFGDRDGHQIFLEPEGLDDDTVYPNGISTSLPEDVQLDMLANHPRAGEGVGCCSPATRSSTTTSIRASSTPTLETQASAGPVPGRPDQRHHRLRGSGGARHGGRAQRGAPGRRRGGRHASAATEAYIGVMIDDLVSRGRHRALPHVHVAGRVPAVAARRQCRPAADRRGRGAWDCVGLRRRRRFAAQARAPRPRRGRWPRP